MEKHSNVVIILLTVGVGFCYHCSHTQLFYPGTRRTCRRTSSRDRRCRPSYRVSWCYRSLPIHTGN